MLAQAQFAHLGLFALYRGLGTSTVPVQSHGRCKRLVHYIDAAHKPNDTDLPNLGYQLSGNVYSLNVDGVHRVTYQWNLGKADQIDYV